MILEILNYILFSTAVWIVFLSCYVLLFRKETFFQLNRGFLLFTFLLGAVSPVLRNLEINILSDVAPSFVVPLESNLMQVSVALEEAARDRTMIDLLLQIGLFVYLAGLAFFATKLFLGLKYLWTLYINGRRDSFKEARLIWIKEDHAPFSFFNTIFLHEKYRLDPALQKVLAHEYAHISGRHSIDILLIEIVGMFFWPSPLIQIYKKALRSVHEYMADAKVLTNHRVIEYGKFLLNFQYDRLETSLVNSIISSQLKDRIIMMGKKQSAKSRLLKYALSLPLFLILFSLIAIKSEAQQKTKEVFKIVEEMPRFPGCEEITDQREKQDCSTKKMGQFIMENLKYPESARKAGIEGLSVVQFIVSETGALDNIKLARSFHEECDQAALEVVKAMPDFVPGKQRGRKVAVYYNLPIRFALGEGEKDKENILSPMVVTALEKSTKTSAHPSKPTPPPPPPPPPKAVNAPTNPNAAPPPPPPPPSVGHEKEVFKVVEEMPRFPGCENEATKAAKEKCAQEAMMRYLYSNIMYPKEAREKGVEGLVIVQFIVEKEGSISNVKTIRGIGAGCDEESVRVVDSMPDFIPGKQRGKAVAVQYNLPVKFKLEKETKKEKKSKH